jgi:hypothetical protein
VWLSVLAETMSLVRSGMADYSLGLGKVESLLLLRPESSALRADQYVSVALPATVFVDVDKMETTSRTAQVTEASGSCTHPG